MFGMVIGTSFAQMSGYEKQSRSRRYPAQSQSWIIDWPKAINPIPHSKSENYVAFFCCFTFNGKMIFLSISARARVNCWAVRASTTSSAMSLQSHSMQKCGDGVAVKLRLREIPQEFAHVCQILLQMDSYEFQLPMNHDSLQNCSLKPHKVQTVWVSAVGISADSALYLPFPKCRFLSPKLPTLNFLHQLRGIKVVILD